EFRTVTLHYGAPSSPLQCSLTPASLSSPPQYNALTCVWGHEATRSQITLNSHLFSVTANLVSALHRIRSDTEDRVLWIDALAINQCDIAERNHRVARMRDIYAAAELVLAWLG
ncbi:hypothetical protein K469DRAFT_518222, partial [Zopfia rhizophila CBS 207.26]